MHPADYQNAASAAACVYMQSVDRAPLNRSIWHLNASAERGEELRRKVQQKVELCYRAIHQVLFDPFCLLAPLKLCTFASNQRLTESSV